MTRTTHDHGQIIICIYVQIHTRKPMQMAIRLITVYCILLLQLILVVIRFFFQFFFMGGEFKLILTYFTKITARIDLDKKKR